jgi:hypothetical protein
MECFSQDNNNLVFQYEMLFDFHIRTEKYQSDEKQVDGEGDPWMLLYGMPGSFHVRRPVDIIKDEQGLVMGLAKALLKVLQCWCRAMITIDIYIIQLRYFL